MSDPVKELRRWLDGAAKGSIDSELQPTLVKFLAAAWKELDGHDQTEMSDAKVRRDRIETPVWDAPRLMFRIERHPQTVHGSSRADVQDWVVDLDALTARSVRVTRRQVRPTQKKIDCGKLAEELSDLILKKAPDERLKWSLELDAVQLQIDLFIPGCGPKSTYEGRRKRLRARLAELLKQHDWTSPMPNKFQARR